jgi:hypothetical protein
MTTGPIGAALAAGHRIYASPHRRLAVLIAALITLSLIAAVLLLLPVITGLLILSGVFVLLAALTVHRRHPIPAEPELALFQTVPTGQPGGRHRKVNNTMIVKTRALPPPS